MTTLISLIIVIALFYYGWKYILILFGIVIFIIWLCKYIKQERSNKYIKEQFAKYKEPKAPLNSMEYYQNAGTSYPTPVQKTSMERLREIVPFYFPHHSYQITKKYGYVKAYFPKYTNDNFDEEMSDLKEYGFEGDFVTEYNYGELPAKVEKNEYSYEVFVKDDVSKEWESIGIIDRDEKIDADIDKMLYAYVSKYNGWSKVIRDEKIVDEKVRYVYYLDVYYKD